MTHPTPSQIKAARKAARLTQAQAAELVHLSRRAWQDRERGIIVTPLDSWELFLIKTNQAELFTAQS